MCTSHLNADRHVTSVARQTHSCTNAVGMIPVPVPHPACDSVALTCVSPTITMLLSFKLTRLPYGIFGYYHNTILHHVRFCALSIGFAVKVDFYLFHPYGITNFLIWILPILYPYRIFGNTQDSNQPPTTFTK